MESLGQTLVNELDVVFFIYGLGFIFEYKYGTSFFIRFKELKYNDQLK